MLAGELYRGNDPELVIERMRAKKLCAEYNLSAGELNRAVLKDLLGCETDAYFEPPFFCDYGHNLRLGKNVYANHNLVILDCAIVTLGNDVQIAPNVVISTAGHPVDPELRRSGLEFAHPITIGNNVWLGAGVLVLPGVTIGDNATVGAGSVVTRALPPNCVAFGNPCRAVRHIEPGAQPSYKTNS
jgi:maltose O-acetyltransferase